MLKRMAMCLPLVFAGVLCRPAGSAERPTAEAIRSAAAAVRPAVVDIEVRERRPAGQPDWRNWPFVQPPGPGERRQWRFHFRWPPGEEIPRGFPFRGDQPFLRLFQQQTQGSGLIVDVQGDRALIAAPHSVVENAQEVYVRLADGRQLAAKLLGSDKFTGTGCLEVRGAKLQAARPAKAEAVQVGDWVLAVGGPATGGTVTAGIVSAKDRPGAGDLAGTRLILTDALLTDRMAGCPLVNLDGQVVGMTTPSALRWPRRRELTSVVPINTLRATVTSLAQEGKVRRGWLGIRYAPLNREVREQLNIDHGIQVIELVAGQPAEHAGIRNGDVLLEFGGKRIQDSAAFRAMVASTKPGTRVPIKLLRGGQEITVHATLGEQTVQGGAAAAPQGGERLGIGLTLQQLTPELANQFGFPGEKGLLVTAVDAGGPAAKARPGPIRRGDLLKEFDRKAVITLAEAKQAMGQARKRQAKNILLLVRSKEATRYVVVDLPQ